MNYDHSLSGKERGYKKPGAKLLPRCAYNAMLTQTGAAKSSRELRRINAAEVEHYGPDPDRSIRRMLRHRRRLSARAVRICDRLLEGASYDMVVADTWRGAQARYLRAALNHWWAGLAREAEERIYGHP